MTNDQKEALAVLATVATIGLISLAVGKVAGRLSGIRMTKNFDKAVDKKAAEANAQ